MVRIGKIVALFLTSFIVMSFLILLTVNTAKAQTTPKPPAPEFTTKYIDASYDVPPSYSINPYTGENVTQSGHYVDNRTVQITIINSNFAQSIGKLCFMYYNVQIKGHGVENWTDLFSYVPNSPSGLLPQSDNQFTIISHSVQSLPSNVPLDFRVQRFLINQTSGFDVIGTSDWSETQTITIPANPTSSNPSPTVPEIPFVTVLSLLAVIPLITILAKKLSKSL
jgi:hypothetical protein